MAEEVPATIDLNYIKSNNFREIACDGALGGPTPSGKLWVAFYTERFPLPKVVRYPVVGTEDDNLTLAASGQRVEGRDGVVRNVEVGVYLTQATAEQLYHWLGTQLSKIREQKK